MLRDPPNGRYCSSPSAAAVSLLIGVALGVALDRTVLRPTPKDPARPQMVGQWVRTSNCESLEFKADGTFVREMLMLDMTKDKDGVASQPIVGQWHWLEDGRIELDSFGQRHKKARVVVDGKLLKLLLENRDVEEYRRR